MTNATQGAETSVGYRCPPMRTRFQKGTSGNPKGRPKQQERDVEEQRRKLYLEPMTIQRGGKPRKVPRLVALEIQLLKMALQGDPKAMQLAFKLAKELGLYAKGSRNLRDYMQVLMARPEDDDEAGGPTTH